MKRLLLGILVLLAMGSGPARADFADHWARITDVPAFKAPPRGVSRILVMPVEIQTRPHFDMAEVRSYFEKDLESYYRRASGGRFTPDAVVVDPIKFESCPLPAEFTDCAVERGNPAALRPSIDVIRESLRQLDARGFDFKQVDVNGPEGTADGTIDGILLLVNVEFGGIALPVGNFNTGDNLAGGQGGSFVVDGVKVPYVAIGGTNGVMLHEFGHLLGLTDLYDEDGHGGGLDLSLMGNWSDESKPALMDAESRFRLGWATTLDVTEAEEFTVKPAEAGGFIYRVGDESEYLLIENRGPGPEAMDGELTSRGIAIFHVSRANGPRGDTGAYVSRLLSCVNCNLSRPYVMNVPARGPYRWKRTGRFDVNGLLFHEGESLLPAATPAPFDSANPIASTDRLDGTPTGIRIEVLSRSGDDFRVRVTPSNLSICQSPPKCERGSFCPDLQCPPRPIRPEVEGCSSAGSGLMWSGLTGLVLLAARRRRHFFFFGDENAASKAALALSASESPAATACRSASSK